MNILKLYTEEYDPGVTLVSNVFIDYFLKDANDAQLKVYLYLVRHISNHKPFTISNIADEFNHTEKDVMRALLYWEEKQVISLEYDSHNDLTGIELREITNDLVSKAANNSGFANTSEENQKKSSSDGHKKYTTKDFIEMSTDEDWISIKSLAECYFGRTLSASDLQSLACIYKDLNFSPSDVDVLIEECLSNNKMTMRAILKSAEEKFATMNINPSVTAVMNALGEFGTPSGEQLDIINRWLNEMSLELVLEGCRKATMKTGSNRFGYAEGIFKNWRTQNIKSISDMAASEESYRQSHSSHEKKVAKQPSTQNKFVQFKQTDYDFEALEREAGIR